MSFWTGLEAFTGHRPGAFTGMTMKDLFDKDMWEMRERLGGRQSRQFENTGVVPTTALYKGMGKEGMFGDVVRPYAGAAAPVPVNEWVNPNTQSSPVQMNQLGTAQVQTRALPPRPELNPLDLRMQQSKLDQQGLTTAGQYRAGLQDAVGTLGDAFLPKNVMAQGREMWGDLRDFYYPGKDASNPQFDSTMEQMLDMTTVKKITDDASPNTITQTVKQKVPANPTNTLMNMGRKFMGGWQDLARKRYEEEMLRRQRGY